MASRRIDFKQAVLKVKDGGTNEYTVVLGEGNFQYTEKRNLEYRLDRGVLDDVTEGDQVPVEVSLSAVWDYVKGRTTNLSLEDAIKGVETCSTWVSTDADECRPYAVDLELTYTPSCAAADEEVITLPDFRYDDIQRDLRNQTVSITGRCNVTSATVVRAAQ